MNKATPHLQQLAATSKRLNRASDSFTEELAAIETSLADMNLGIDLDGPILAERVTREAVGGQERTISVQRTSCLSYGRHRDAWRLLVRVCRTEQWPGMSEVDLVETLEDERPLAESTRSLRQLAAGQIVAFLQQLEAEARSRADSIERQLAATPRAAVVTMVPEPTDEPEPQYVSVSVAQEPTDEPEVRTITVRPVRVESFIGSSDSARGSRKSRGRK